jgi:hypothetical protein
MNRDFESFGIEGRTVLDSIALTIARRADNGWPREKGSDNFSINARIS